MGSYWLYALQFAAGQAVNCNDDEFMTNLYPNSLIYVYTDKTNDDKMQCISTCTAGSSKDAPTCSSICKNSADATVQMEKFWKGV